MVARTAAAGAAPVLTVEASGVAVTARMAARAVSADVAELVEGPLVEVLAETAAAVRMVVGRAGAAGAKVAAVVPREVGATVRAGKAKAEAVRAAAEEELAAVARAMVMMATVAAARVRAARVRAGAVRA